MIDGGRYFLVQGKFYCTVGMCCFVVRRVTIVSFSEMYAYQHRRRENSDDRKFLGNVCVLTQAQKQADLKKAAAAEAKAKEEAAEAAAKAEALAKATKVMCSFVLLCVFCGCACCVHLPAGKGLRIPCSVFWSVKMFFLEPLNACVPVPAPPVHCGCLLFCAFS